MKEERKEHRKEYRKCLGSDVKIILNYYEIDINKDNVVNLSGLPRWY